MSNIRIRVVFLATLLTLCAIAAPQSQRLDEAGLAPLAVARDRARRHGRPHRRRRGRRTRSLDHLRRRRVGRRVEDHQRRHHVDAGVRRPGRGLDRRHRPQRHRTRNSCGSAPASPTTGKAPRSATASTSRSTAAGRGRTWACATRSTSAASIVDPVDPDIVYVAALGHLWGPNAERGVFKTTDGGRTWTNVKFIDEDTGFVDVVDGPAQPARALRRGLPAAAGAVGLQRRWPRQRHLQDRRRRTHVDKAHTGLPTATSGGSAWRSVGRTRASSTPPSSIAPTAAPFDRTTAARRGGR